MPYCPAVAAFIYVNKGHVVFRWYINFIAAYRAAETVMRNEIALVGLRYVEARPGGESPFITGDAVMDWADVGYPLHAHWAIVVYAIAPRETSGQGGRLDNLLDRRGC